MSPLQLGLAAVLVVCVIASGIGVVYSKYLSRRYFVVLQERQSEQRKLEIEWQRLQLEEGALATHFKIERLARNKLKMHLPRVDEVVVIRR